MATTITIDPGHGGSTTVGGSSPNNATGPGGTLEKVLTLDIAKRLKAALEIRHDVLMTRTEDTNLGLHDRAHVARNASAEVFISIHFNGFNDATVQGTETLVWQNVVEPAKSYLLAQKVQAELVAVTQYRDRGVKNNQQLAVLDPNHHIASTAACLVEISFITGPGLVAPESDEGRLESEEYRNAIAGAIASGIEDYLS